MTSPEQQAQATGLLYVSDTRAGFRRRRQGTGFCYLDQKGRIIRDADELRRIRALAIPPAWTRVWICPSRRGHLQASGRDARGRKQFRYHADWRAQRDANKYKRLLSFGQALPRLRRRVARHLALPGLPRKKVLAALVKLLETTFIRVGNEEYARTNGSVGLTTMRSRHVKVRGATIRFHFPGKSGQWHDIHLTDRRLGKIVKRCQELPGQQLFQYIDESKEVVGVDSQDVNDYLRHHAGSDFTTKDFRTWGGTLLAATLLKRENVAVSEAQLRRRVARAIGQVASHLGNTKPVCRKCYVHPGVIEAYGRGWMKGAWQRIARVEGLRNDEVALIRLLRKSQRSARRSPPEPARKAIPA